MRIPNAWTAGLVLACVAAVGASSDASPRAISGAAAERSGDSPPTQIGRTHPYFLRKVREILTPPEEGTAPVQEELVAELVALGPESIPTLLAFLTGEAMLLQADQPAEMGWAGRHGGTRQDIVILDALRLFPAKRVLLEVQREVGEEADYGVRMVAMRVLARVAGPGAFDVWEHTVSGIEPLLLMRVQQDSPIRDALEFILESDRSAYRDLKDAVPALHPPLWPQIAEAVGGVGGEAGLDVLARLAGRSAEADAAVLEQVGAIAERLYSSSPQGCYSWVRPMLRAEDPRTRSRAIDTLVDLGDADSIHDFVEMLEDPSRRVQAAARQALEELSGRRLGTNRDAWGEWYRRYFLRHDLKVAAERKAVFCMSLGSTLAENRLRVVFS